MWDNYQRWCCPVGEADISFKKNVILFANVTFLCKKEIVYSKMISDYSALQSSDSAHNK